MRVPLLDLKAQYARIREEVRQAVDEVFESQRFILGPQVEALERETAAYCGARFAVGVSSGTDALLISLMAAGVGAGDLVVTTPYTFFATAGAIHRVGARPLFVDIEADTFNMDPRALEAVLAGLGREDRARVKALIPVHLFGQCAEMDTILEVAEAHGLAVIEDAAQAIGSEYRFADGRVRRAGAMGRYGCFSFFPSKNLGAFGDGGMVTTDDEAAYERLKILRVHGARPKYHHHCVGGNFRLDAVQAAVLRVKLRHLDRWTAKRRSNAENYRKLFARAGLQTEIQLPLDKGHRHIYNQFVISVEDKRDALKEHLQGRGIGCEIYYPVPLHAQPCFEDLGYLPGDFPVALAASKKTLALPIYPELSDAQMEYVVDIIGEFFQQANMEKWADHPKKVLTR